jgi:hypothetical protein
MPELSSLILSMLAVLLKGLGALAFCGVRPRPSDPAKAKHQSRTTSTGKYLTVYEVSDTRQLVSRRRNRTIRPPVNQYRSSY